MKINRSLGRRQRLLLVGLIVGLLLMAGGATRWAHRYAQSGSQITNPDAPATAELAAGLRVAGR